MIVPSSVPVFSSGVAPTTAQLNTLSQGLAIYLNPPRVHAYSSVAQTIPNGAYTALAFALESYDSDGMHSLVTNTDRLTAVTPGTYTFVAQFSYVANATGVRYGVIWKNGAAIDGVTSNPAAAGAATGIIVYQEVYLAVGDYVQAMAYQASGGALNVSGEVASLNCSFQGHWFAAS